MKSNYLFPHKYKKIGWMILVPSAILGLIALVGNYEPAFLNWRVPSILMSGMQGKSVFSVTNQNLLNEILSILCIVSLLLVAFSKEKNEDEFIAKIRLNALVWATYVNYGILLIAFVAVYGFSFLWVMVLNMFTILIFFIIRFNWLIYKSKSIKVERAKKNITQAELAKLAKVSRQTINAMELGKYAPSTVLALRLAKIFEVEVSEIFVLEDSDWE